MTVQAAVRPLPDRPVSTWTGWGQWLALATMTLDHLTRYVAPDTWELGWAGSSLGRIAFPLFAAMVAWHGLFNTRNPLRYARRILVIGLAAQLPYMLMPRASDAFLLNVCFTLALGLAWGAWLRDLLARQRSGSLGSAWLAAALAASLAVWYLLGEWFEYGHRGLLLVPLFMLAMHHLHTAGETLAERLTAVAMAAPLLVVAGLMNSSDMAKSFTVATCLAVLWLAAGAHRLTPVVPTVMPRRLWLAWYPGHFALIALWLWASGGLG
ncbi:TraX [Halomonas sp. MCCC 1A17488]|uniref:TraX family protein n=1 Tax=unclassified Halomonas TaxID=2609666 RepID=UPI0018D26B6A|nr:MULTISPECIES: TraX family protein [unclassified Halomonas]MCE8017644.1 TraX [Halomonas sp. MCCC 1A17488]MCG3240977.1 TraX [Halomonas sp. MCCC 1A17488]QPP48846.1 TraX [Halomonas sp. SS10-MC5]